jgi:hypothetical protein
MRLLQEYFITKKPSDSTIQHNEHHPQDFGCGTGSKSDKPENLLSNFEGAAKALTLRNCLSV